MRSLWVHTESDQQVSAFPVIIAQELQGTHYERLVPLVSDKLGQCLDKQTRGLMHFKRSHVAHIMIKYSAQVRQVMNPEHFWTFFIADMPPPLLSGNLIFTLGYMLYSVLALQPCTD
jgi:hypothetical protein